MKIWTFENESFEVHTSKMLPVAPITGCKRGELYDFYDRPSIIKQQIWSYWCDWCDKMNKNGYECGIEISGANCNFFSISGSIRKDGVIYDIFITRSHNRLYKHN